MAGVVFSANFSWVSSNSQKNNKKAFASILWSVKANLMPTDYILENSLNSITFNLDKVGLFNLVDCCQHFVDKMGMRVS
jgi:hypothetical protein